MKRGRFIVLEGIDGSGTTTQTNLLHDYIKSLDKDNDVLTTHEPWRNEDIKRMLTEEKDAYSSAETLARLYVFNRSRHVEGLILPNLNGGVFVISDRYHLSTYGYQYTQGVDLKVLEDLHKEYMILNPDVTILLDVGLDVALERLRKRGAPLEKFERNPDFTRKLIDNYREIAQKAKIDGALIGRIEILDGNKGIEEVANSIKAIFDFICK
ncbi:MAG: dTMP kinase [Nanoarchaeota archaeon]